MELLSKELINSQNFKLLKKIMKNNYINQKGFEDIISYDEFKNIIVSFILKTMNLYLRDTLYSFDKCSCFIKILTNENGSFNHKDNKIIIDEKVIKEIYGGKISKMVVIFHELNHFKNKYDILLGKNSEEVIRTIKELLLRLESEDGLDKKSIKKTSSTLIDYYYSNYELYSEEKIVEINAISDFILFAKLCNIKLTNEQIIKLEKDIKDNLRQYNIHLRDLTTNMNFNDNYLTFEDAFDVSIKDNPDWLDFPQLNIEYTLKDGKVVKRNKKELQKRLENELDEDVRKYIQGLLNKMNDIKTK